VKQQVALALVLASLVGQVQCCARPELLANGHRAQANRTVRRAWPGRIHCKGVTLVLVPQGTRSIGTNNSRAERGEAPAFKFELNYVLYMGATEITAKQFRFLMGTYIRPIGRSRIYANPDFGDDYPNTHPAFCKWEVADEFCKRFEDVLEEQTGWEWECRLPKEAEWEYAARFGRPAWEDWWPSDRYLHEHEWYRGNAGGDFRPVATKKPNPLGLYDMLGNIHEWCDGRLADHEALKVACGGKLLESVERDGLYGGRPIRGGGLFNDDDKCRPSRRNGWGTTTHTAGFRIVAVPVPPYHRVPVRSEN